MQINITYLSDRKIILVFTNNIILFITFIIEKSIYYFFTSLPNRAIAIINKRYCIRKVIKKVSKKTIQQYITAYTTLSSCNITNKPKTCFVSLFKYYVNDVYSAYDSKPIDMFFFARLSIDDLLRDSQTPICGIRKRVCYVFVMDEIN